MATRTAVKTGNWSDPTVWDSDPVLPGAGDVAECAGYTVTIDQDVTVATLQSSGAGYFAVTAARTITGAVLSNTGHSGGAVLRVSHGSGTVSITGSVTGGPNVGLTFTGNNSTLVITGNVTAGPNTLTSGIIKSGLNSTLTITGDVAGGAGTGAVGVYQSSTGTTTINGTVTGGNGANAYGAWNQTTGTMTVTGLCIGGGAISSFGLYGQSSSAVTQYYSAKIGHRPAPGVGGFVKMIVSPTVNFLRVVRSDTGADYDLSNDYPTAAQVESGVTYKLGTLTGELVAGGGGFPILGGSIVR